MSHVTYMSDAETAPYRDVWTIVGLGESYLPTYKTAWTLRTVLPASQNTMFVSNCIGWNKQRMGNRKARITNRQEWTALKQLTWTDFNSYFCLYFCLPRGGCWGRCPQGAGRSLWFVWCFPLLLAQDLAFTSTIIWITMRDCCIKPYLLSLIQVSTLSVVTLKGTGTQSMEGRTAVPYWLLMLDLT